MDTMKKAPKVYRFRVTFHNRALGLTQTDILLSTSAARLVQDIRAYSPGWDIVIELA